VIMSRGEVQPLEVFLVPAEAAAQLGVSVRQLRRMRKRGTGPAYYRICSRIRYLAADLTRWRVEHPEPVEGRGRLAA